MRLTGLFIYPVKGCRGVAVSENAVDNLGLSGDRRFMVVDQNGVFITQRTDPVMATIETRLDANTLTLANPQCAPVVVPREEKGAALLQVKIWSSSDLLAEDCGESAASWLSKILGRASRLVRVGTAFDRPVLKPAAVAGDRISFPDACPFLIISENSLADLNDRLDGPLPMNRFRPNLVVSDCAAFAEDTWKKIKIGPITFRAAGPCARCPVITTDQMNGEREKEPLRTLSLYRRDRYEPSKVNFGQNLLHESMRGSIRVGDLVEILETNSELPGTALDRD